MRINFSLRTPTHHYNKVSEEMMTGCQTSLCTSSELRGPQHSQKTLSSSTAPSLLLAGLYRTCVCMDNWLFPRTIRGTVTMVLHNLAHPRHFFFFFTVGSTVKFPHDSKSKITKQTMMIAKFFVHILDSTYSEKGKSPESPNNHLHFTHWWGQM